MKANIRDVAREANVSMSTVSRVMNKNYPVKEETKIRVEKAVEKLNFSPNTLARSLICQNTKTIGILVPSIDNLFFPTVIKAIEYELRINGYSIYLCDTADNASEEIKYIRSLMGRQVDGIIVIDPKTENMKNGFYEMVGKDIPLVSINGYNKDIDCNFVLNDEANGARQAMEYLLKLGHENIIFVRGKESYSYDIKENVYIKFMEENKLTVQKKIIDVGEGNSYDTVDGTMNIMKKELENLKAPIAVFSCNDLMALGVLNACKKMNLDVPNEVSIIGFDNICISSIVEPKLTTVDQNMYLLGENAAKMLLDLIDNNNQKVNRIKLSTKLIIRDSCSNI
ncbi:LacI family transcriptional regulator [Clostridium estertheticum]|uniref:LacI family DNA-binding transcriptional regulator n=1 Tax=Clostridium estertheticum TaxID=238834 RepID=UPI001CF1208B|nr:LacI family DNA-binding transcriptional regulator [Clostridium estertheticum]MCB2306908.1 LacI family transcriptional regulator [Clostridium estertheticum]MCB2345303.1 LacI family transcriptional regulator [Clostridium estertheticum]MCB2350414.1 LacI family transcriptional regulator [Clostridium estertheticum]WAG45193.1 LacI family transcriptional regulator [Clostridium estertheticum]